MSVDDLAQLYRDVMTDILDRHCPVVTIRRRARPMTLSAVLPGAVPEPLREDSEV